MGSFFKKSGNGGGLFPDVSIEEQKSLFKNDDERDASCPCAIEDNPNSPTAPTSCEPAEPVYLPVEEPGLAPVLCSQYSGVVNNVNDNIIGPYTDCNDVVTEYNYTGFTGFQPFVFCGKPGQTLNAPFAKGFQYVETPDCGNLECLQYSLLIESPGVTGFYTWVDCNGVAQVVNYEPVDLPISLLICAQVGTFITVGVLTEIGACP